MDMYSRFMISFVSCKKELGWCYQSLLWCVVNKFIRSVAWLMMLFESNLAAPYKPGAIFDWWWRCESTQFKISHFPTLGCHIKFLPTAFQMSIVVICSLNCLYYCCTYQSPLYTARFSPSVTNSFDFLTCICTTVFCHQSQLGAWVSKLLLIHLYRTKCKVILYFNFVSWDTQRFCLKWFKDSAERIRTFQFVSSIITFWFCIR